MADTSKVVDILFRGEDQTSGAIQSVKKALDGIGDSSGKIGEVSDEMDRLGGFSEVARGALAQLAAVAGLGVLTNEFIEANVEVERFSKAVTAISGDGRAAGSELEYLRSTADRLGLSVSDASSQYVSLLAATKGTALEGAQARAIFESVAGAMSALGRSSADTQGALLAIQQIVSKGTVSAEELRGQLGERLPGAFQIAARSVGVTTQELGKMLEQGQLLAVDFLPKFAGELSRTFQNTGDVEGYTASVNRLGNAWNEFLQQLGSTGAFDLAASGIAGLANSFKAGNENIEAASIRWQAFKNLLSGGSFAVYNLELEQAAKLTGDFSLENDKSNETLAETERLLRLNSDAAKNAYPDETTNETKRLAAAANVLTDQLKSETEALKTLRVNRDEVNRSTADYAALIEQIGKSQGVTDAEFLAGVAEAAKRVDGSVQSFNALRDAITASSADGARGSDVLAQAMAAVESAAEKAAAKTDENAKAIKRQAEESQKAEEQAARMRLELEKLASNERIKTIEANVQLNVAQVQEDTKRIQSAFDSINTTIESTADIINKAFGLLASGNWLDSSVRNALFDQIDQENINRREALRLQSELTQAQIKVLEAQTRQMDAGDALIKVDGTGLKPHLEAILWELLKAIQIRINRQGLNQLLGVGA